MSRSITELAVRKNQQMDGAKVFFPDICVIFEPRHFVMTSAMTPVFSKE